MARFNPNFFFLIIFFGLMKLHRRWSLNVFATIFFPCNLVFHGAKKVRKQSTWNCVPTLIRINSTVSRGKWYRRNTRLKRNFNLSSNLITSDLKAVIISFHEFLLCELLFLEMSWENYWEINFRSLLEKEQLFYSDKINTFIIIL